MAKTVRRKDWHKFHKLGMKVKAKRKWRKARGRHNKIRESKRGHSARPKIGYRVITTHQAPIIIENMNQLRTLGKNKGIIAGRIGGKKRMMMIEEAKKLGLTLINTRKNDNQPQKEKENKK